MWPPALDSTVDRIDQIKLLNLSWAADSSGFYYNQEKRKPGIPENMRGGQADIHFHHLGDSLDKDVLIHEHLGDPGKAQGVGATRDGHYLFHITYQAAGKMDVIVRDLRVAGSSWQPLAVGLGANFAFDEWHDRFYVRTDWKAPHYRILTGLPGQRIEQYQEIVAEEKDRVLDGLEILGGKLALTWLRVAASELELRELDGKLLRTIALPTLGSAYWDGDSDDDDAYYSFQSFVTSPTTWKTSVKTGKTELFWHPAIKLDRLDASKVVVTQEWLTSKDGTRVPTFNVSKRDAKGPSPFLLSGYGGFGISETPGFWQDYAVWVEAGGAIADVNLRGGGEFGAPWHEAGMMHHKQNVFDDFIAAAEFLIKRGDTTRDQLAIAGWSNGGLLMGAALTQRPDLFRAVLCGAPLLDMIRYTRFGIGSAYTHEFGAPDSADDFPSLWAYSPYHHVKPAAYPAVLGSVSRVGRSRGSGARAQDGGGAAARHHQWTPSAAAHGAARGACGSRSPRKSDRRRGRRAGVPRPSSRPRHSLSPQKRSSRRSVTTRRLPAAGCTAGATG